MIKLYIFFKKKKFIVQNLIYCSLRDSSLDILKKIHQDLDSENLWKNNTKRNTKIFFWTSEDI